MKLYRTQNGAYVERDGMYYPIASENWDELICDSDLNQRLHESIRQNIPETFDATVILSPVVSQEVWAAGVTYYRSRDARMEESKDSGGGNFYDRVYSAERPELFFKATGRRVVGHREGVRIRSDAKWSVPEPELTLFVSPAGTIVGYTVGNDMSSRDIEGENPLYLPQAKVYDGSCALGPCILVSNEPLSKETDIQIDILRDGRNVFSGNTKLTELKRDPVDLVKYLFRDNSFPYGVFLMTGTGVVPGDDFSLASGDIIRIQISEIGTLENHVA